MFSNIDQKIVPKNYGSASNYADEVRKWVYFTKHAMAWQQMSFLHSMQFQLSQQYSSLAQNAVRAMQANELQHRTTTVIRLNLARLFNANTDTSPQTLIIQQCTIPSFFRRIAAEAIDSCILFIFKLFIVFMLIEIDLIDLDQFEKILTNEMDLQSVFEITQGFFYVEILFKIFTGFLEAICITYGVLNYPYGCTPGKFMMQLKVVSCMDIQPIAGVPNRVAITGYSKVHIKNSLTRSILKNVLTVFLFPLSTAFYMFSYNRAVYDLAAKTIVVNL